MTRDEELFELYRPLLEAKQKLARAQTFRGDRLASARKKDRDPRRRALAEAIKFRRTNERLEAKALELRPRGPNLPQWMFHNPKSYVVEADLQDLPQDGGWYRAHRDEFKQRGHAEGLPPLAIALRMLLVWCHQRRDGGDGAGFQGRLGALAAILGCDRSYVYKLITLLKAKGFAKRFDRKRRYANLAAQLSDGFQNALGAHQTFKRWKDSSGKLRTFIDVQGVAYATRKAVHATLAVELGSDGKAIPQEAWKSLWKTLKAVSRNLRHRLLPASAQLQKETPYAVPVVARTISFRALAAKSRAQSPPEQKSSG